MPVTIIKKKTPALELNKPLLKLVTTQWAGGGNGNFPFSSVPGYIRGLASFERNLISKGKGSKMILQELLWLYQVAECRVRYG